MIISHALLSYIDKKKRMVTPSLFLLFFLSPPSLRNPANLDRLWTDIVRSQHLSASCQEPLLSLSY